MLTVNEIYRSIQGESTFAGRACVFVRLTACDLRCSWCDTPYAFEAGRKMTVAAVMDQVRSHGCPLVEITGGEPLLQADLYPLVDQLLGTGHTVLVETGGHRSLERLPPQVIKIMDVKCPGSGEADKNHWPNIEYLTRRDEVKFVVRDRVDYAFARQVIADRDLIRRCGAVLLSPVHAVLEPRELAAWILEDGLEVRLQLQLHKYVWGAQARGV